MAGRAGPGVQGQRPVIGVGEVPGVDALDDQFPLERLHVEVRVLVPVALDPLPVGAHRGLRPPELDRRQALPDLDPPAVAEVDGLCALVGGQEAHAVPFGE